MTTFPELTSDLIGVVGDYLTLADFIPLSSLNKHWYTSTRTNHMQSRMAFNSFNEYKKLLQHQYDTYQVGNSSNPRVKGTTRHALHKRLRKLESVKDHLHFMRDLVIFERKYHEILGLLACYNRTVHLRIHPVDDTVFTIWATIINLLQSFEHYSGRNEELCDPSKVEYLLSNRHSGKRKSPVDEKELDKGLEQVSSVKSLAKELVCRKFDKYSILEWLATHFEYYSVSKRFYMNASKQVKQKISNFLIKIIDLVVESVEPENVFQQKIESRPDPVYLLFRCNLLPVVEHVISKHRHLLTQCWNLQAVEFAIMKRCGLPITRCLIESICVDNYHALASYRTQERSVDLLQVAYEVLWRMNESKLQYLFAKQTAIYLMNLKHCDSDELVFPKYVVRVGLWLALEFSPVILDRMLDETSTITVQQIQEMLPIFMHTVSYNKAQSIQYHMEYFFSRPAPAMKAFVESIPNRKFAVEDLSLYGISSMHVFTFRKLIELGWSLEHRKEFVQLVPAHCREWAMKLLFPSGD